MVDSAVFRFAVPATLAVLVSGCALPPPSGCMSEPTAGATLVSLPQEVMGKAVRRVRFTDPWQFDVYVLYRGVDGARLEATYLQARYKFGTNVVLNFNDPLERRVLGFAYNAGTHPKFGKSVWIDSAFGGMWAKSFRHPVTGQQCAGFVASWDWRSDDPKGRPSKAIYGYYCAANGASLDLTAKDNVLSKLKAGLKPVDFGIGGPACEDAGVRSTLSVGHDILIRAQPSGKAGSPAAAGDSAFPLARATRFHDYNDDSNVWE